MAQHLARRLGKDDFLADAGPGHLDDDAAGGFGGLRGIADLRHLLVALDEHQMAEFLGDVLEARLRQRGGELEPEIGGDRAIDLRRRLRGQTDHTEATLRQLLLADDRGDRAAARPDAIILDPKPVATLGRPARAHHPQRRPGNDDRLAFQRKYHAAFVVVVADVALIHLARAEAGDEKTVHLALAHQPAHARPAAVALGEREDGRLNV